MPNYSGKAPAQSNAKPAAASHSDRGSVGPVAQTVAAEPVVQRVMKVGGNPTDEGQAYADLVNHKKNFAEKNEKILKAHLLPAFSADGRKFDDIDDVYFDAWIVLQDYEMLLNPKGAGSAKKFIADQIELQNKVKVFRHFYTGLFTTAGYEHEFAQMRDGPLRGVSHLELAEFSPAMPLTGIKFILETDAANALELVSPPFIVASLPGKPVPLSGPVVEIDKLLTQSLDASKKALKIGVRTSYNPFNTTTFSASMKDFIARVGADLGIKPHMKDVMPLETHHYSHITDVDKFPQSQVDKATVNNIQVEQITKGGYGVTSSQLNFATDAQSIVDMDRIHGYNNHPFQDPMASKVLVEIDMHLKQLFVAPSYESSEMKSFGVLFRRKLSGLMAEFSHDYALAKQRATKTYAQSQRNSNSVHPITDKNEFIMHANFSSYVKDVTGTWAKDHLASLAEGMLKGGDWVALWALVNRVEKMNIPLPSNLANPQSSEGKFVKAKWKDYETKVKQSLASFKLFVDKKVKGQRTTEQDRYVKKEMHETSNLNIGARPDTYLDPQKVQMGQVWKGKRLHVAEIRRGGTVKMLDALAQKIQEPKSKDDFDSVEADTKRFVEDLDLVYERVKAGNLGKKEKEHLHQFFEESKVKLDNIWLPARAKYQNTEHYSKWLSMVEPAYYLVEKGILDTA
ncbi:hypothetical protein KFE98_12570 [bacterium SCSIO 12741]|nr:hypothetical protein KFE98_12570 [bacterium SCSIO 12741]